MQGRFQDLTIALALGLFFSLLFRAYPQIDLTLSGLFHDGRRFFVGDMEFFRVVRRIGILMPRIVVLGLVGVMIAKLVWPFRRMLIRPRIIVFLLLSLAVGPGLTTNTILKDNWGRPRPNEIIAFGGKSEFVKPWTISDQCPRNCSFVSGEASSAFWTLALAILAPPALRPVAIGAAFGFGIVVGGLRIAFGGHFLSDVMLAGFITYVVTWLCHAWIFRLRPGFADDDRIERGFNLVGHRLYRTVRASRRGLVGMGRRAARMARRRRRVLAATGERFMIARRRRTRLSGLSSHASPAE